MKIAQTPFLNPSQKKNQNALRIETKKDVFKYLAC